MKFINIETEESQESTQQTINYSRSEYINIDLPYDDLYLMDTVATDSFDNEPKKIELINPINVQGLDKCYQSLKYFTIDNLFSELQTSILKELARKNLGIDLDTISVQGDIKLGIINLSQLSEVKQIQSELTETNQIAYFIITDNSGKLPSKLTAYSVPTNVVRQLLFASPNPTTLALLDIVASKVSFSPIGVNVGDLIALTRIKVKVSDLTNVIGITIPGTSEIELYLYKILATNDAKPYNYNGITQGVMGLMSPWDKTEVNKISGIENIANAALPRIDYLPSKWENNMNNCLETGVYPWCTLGRPVGSTGAYTCISIKSSTNDGNYYTIEQTAYGRLNELGQIYKRIIFYKKDGTDTLYHDWINISDSFKTNYYTKDESVELFAKKTSVEANNEKISKILSGETPVEKADKLTTKRTIRLSGYAVSNTPYFDGSSNVTISVNSINDRGLLLGQSPKEGDYYRAKMTPIDTANLEFSTNRLAFNKPECITIEYSNDGGSTWLDYGATDILKIEFISGIGTSFFLGKNITALTANQDMLRIKINHNRGAYTNMQRLYIYLTTQGAMVDNSYALLCKVEKSLCKDPENLSLVGNYLVSGWSGWNSINIDGYFGSVSDNNIHTIQLTFSFNNLSSAYISKTKAKIMKLQMLGNTVFTNSTGCKLLQTGHIYDYDLYKNAIFPGKVTSTILESNIETGTAPIKVKSTTKVSNLKSEYSEKDVNGNIIHTTYATKLEVENEINRAEKIVRKEDIVNNLTDGGADKALSAEMGKELEEGLYELESKTIGKPKDFTISYTAQYQQQKLERTIFKGSRIVIPDEVILTGKTNSSDSSYQTIKNGFIADRDINFLKNSTYIGEVNIRAEHVNNVLLPINVDYCVNFPARKSGVDSSSNIFAGYVINLAGLFELGVRFIKFKASSMDPLQEQNDRAIIPAIIYTNDGVELEVLSDSSYNLLRRSGVQIYSTYWFRVPITANSSILRVSYGLHPTSAGVNSHIFIPSGVYLESENIEAEEIDKLSDEVGNLSDEINELKEDISGKTLEATLSYTAEYQTQSLPFTIKQGSTIRLSRDVKVTCRTNTNDSTYQVVTDGVVANRDINFVKSAEFTGELTIKAILKGEIDKLSDEVGNLKESVLEYDNNLITAKEGSGIAYREMSRCGLRPIKILGVGNSWTGNATLYLGNILNSLGLPADISTSYAGSATLEMYNNNINNPTPIFTHRKWNKNTGDWESSDVLPYEDIFISENWDIITHQQQSARAGKYDTFQPYLNNIINWEKKVSRVSPLIAMHATWAYPDGYDNAMFEEYYGSDTTTMYNSLLSAYNQAMIDEKIGIVFPSAPIIQQVRALGVESIDTSDGGSHLSTNGCFAASCVWAEMLLRYYYYESVSNGKSVTDSSYKPGSLSEEQASQIRALAVDIVNNLSNYFPAFNPL